jgi:biopolymer transport protein ExbD
LILKFSEPEPEDTNIELTPLIDVVFILLIFFMVSTTFTREATIEVNLPEVSEQAEEQPEPNSFELHITRNSSYALQKSGEESASLLLDNELDTLRRALQEVAAPEVLMIIRADRKAPHEAVVQAMDVAGKLGIQRMSFATNEIAE